MRGFGWPHQVHADLLALSPNIGVVAAHVLHELAQICKEALPRQFSYILLCGFGDVDCDLQFLVLIASGHRLPLPFLPAHRPLVLEEPDEVAFPGYLFVVLSEVFE